MKYNHKAVEPKWQEVWEQKGVFHALDNSDKEKFYALIEFPYPSGQGLHVGHPRPYTALDTVARKRRLQGYNVLYPIGWDAFGLPTENYAIKNHVHPEIVTKNNIARFKKQIQSLGISFDWSREINTTDPDYYKWTQWIFIQLFKKGLAYKKEMNVNWCTSCKCVLANEEVVNGVCERCGSEVVHKVKSQWMLKITEYADRLINDLDLVDYPERVKAQQKNWIGRSTGAEVDFATTTGDTLTVYTTRADTLYGATYMVISPEHPLIEKWADKLGNMDEIRAYQAAAARKSDFERTEVAKDKTGVKLDGVKAINPVNNTEIPIFISDYVLVSYGTGAIMAVPAHDTRDWEFAKKFDLPIIEVVKGGNVQEEAFTDCATGIMVNSGMLDGLSVDEAKKKIMFYATQSREPMPYYLHKEIGYNYRMSNICAGIGRGQMTVFEEHLAHHKHLCDRYVEGITVHTNLDERSDSNYWLNTILIDPDKTGTDYETVRLHLETCNIESRPLWKPMHTQPVFSGAPAYVNGVSEHLFSMGLCLPSGPWVSDEDVERVAREIISCCKK